MKGLLLTLLGISLTSALQAQLCYSVGVDTLYRRACTSVFRTLCVRLGQQPPTSGEQVRGPLFATSYTSTPSRKYCYVEKARSPAALSVSILSGWGTRVEAREQTTVLLIDFDGTLVDTVPILMRIYMAFLAEHGVQGTDEEFEYLNGRSRQEALAYWKETHSLEPSIEELGLDYMRRLRELYATEVEFFPGAVEFLEIVRASGLRLAIVSSANAELVHAVLRRTGVDALVEAVVTPEAVHKSKPDPAIFLRALEVMGVSPLEALVIEDAPNGVRAAIAAGIPTIVICREGTPPDMPHGVLATVSTWDEVLHLATSK